MKISDFNISEKVLIVAEIGNNHEGNFDLAKMMIEQAAEIGADAVKFQTFQTEHYVSVTEDERFKQLRKFELTYAQFKELSDHAREHGLIFFTTPFDLESATAVENFVPAYKISSGDNTFWPLLKHIAKKGKPILISTGLIELNELEKTVEIIRKHGNFDSLKNYLVLLHCISAYPATKYDLNLLSIKFLQDHFDLFIGYSDHTQDILSCVVAVSLGARVIEKHFTYRKEGQSFKDHQISADPKEFKEMVSQIRAVEVMLGDYKKVSMPVERQLFIGARRSIAANRDIISGETINIKDVTWVRPAKGFKVGEENLVIGHVAKRKIKMGEIITSEAIEE
ncbi:MAG: N-acetyl neuramic acid synthetase NeuB [Candidatus Scalindua rubra]|uniref:N-acetyl neuramic acid synthetase NeuB n=1 Tax=Candidatus Scalindua rubra TaxID=1872076 RepID=A0A1E3XDP2_9BACT|nr:MAG: N-acetyl neuramic acid synthetase NeuB [Candidatus Scalindua rubra]